MAIKPNPNEPVPVHNAGKIPMYVASIMIPPGETRHIARHHLPAHLLPQDAETPEAESQDPLQELMQQKAPDIKATVPSLSDEHLAQLLELEQTGKKRKGVIEAVQNEQMERLAAAEARETFLKQDAAVIAESAELAAMELPELQALRELEAGESGQRREEVLAAIDGLLNA